MRTGRTPSAEEDHGACSKAPEQLLSLCRIRFLGVSARSVLGPVPFSAGPSHMSLYLMPHRGASLSTWSFGDGTPQFDLSGEYFIFYSHGLDAPTWTFWFEIQVLHAAKGADIFHISALLCIFFLPCELFRLLSVHNERRWEEDPNSLVLNRLAVYPCFQSLFMRVISAFSSYSASKLISMFPNMLNYLIVLSSPMVLNKSAGTAAPFTARNPSQDPGRCSWGFLFFNVILFIPHISTFCQASPSGPQSAIVCRRWAPTRTQLGCVMWKPLNSSFGDLNCFELHELRATQWPFEGSFKILCIS